MMLPTTTLPLPSPPAPPFSLTCCSCHEERVWARRRREVECGVLEVVRWEGDM